MAPNSSADVNNQTLSRFLQRIRKSFSHDLRTPLSAIVNYAAVLESTHAAETDEVHDLGRRIRGNALRIAHMIQLLATATGLASRPLHASTTDLAALARSLLVDSGGRGEVHVATPSVIANLDAEILGFAWRAYVAVETDATGGPIHEADLEVQIGKDEVIAELRCGGSAHAVVPTPGNSVLDVPSYLRHNGGPARLERSLGFSLAQDLVECHGGDFLVWGRPGAASGLRLRLPLAA